MFVFILHLISAPKKKLERARKVFYLRLLLLDTLDRVRYTYKVILRDLCNKIERREISKNFLEKIRWDPFAAYA